MKKAALHNLGCKVNAYETEAMQQLLEEAGYEIVPFQETADVYVVNTCSVTNIADKKSRQMLHRARRQNPQAVVVAAGCYVQTGAREILEEGTVDIILGNNKKKQLPAMLKQYENTREKAADWEDLNEGVRQYERLSMTRTAEHTRAFIKIQDGCNQFCSYCIIPYARGRVRSREPEDILSEIGRLAQSGYQEAVLTGIHLSSYGTDFGRRKGSGLLQLLSQVHEIPGIRRIRLGSLEPGIVTEEFVKEIAQMDKICPHFHLSLQSGSDTVLKRMNRRYGTAEYEARCSMLRSAFTDPAVTTDVITGFPGETEAEALQTEAFIQRIRFYEMHIFKYSRRKGTKAADMAGQIPESVKARRSARLIDLGQAMSDAYRMQMTGRVKTVLLEEPFWYQGEKYFIGYTPEYVKIAVKSADDRSNSFARGTITGQLARDIYLMVEF